MSGEKMEQPAISLADYGDTEINHLAQIHHAMEAMDSDERCRTLKWLKSKYPKEWPTDNY